MSKIEELKQALLQAAAGFATIANNTTDSAVRVLAMENFGKCKMAAEQARLED